MQRKEIKLSRKANTNRQRRSKLIERLGLGAWEFADHCSWQGKRGEMWVSGREGLPSWVVVDAATAAEAASAPLQQQHPCDWAP